MKKFLEKIIHTVVPHKKHRNVPHILRGTSVGIMLVVVLTLFIFSNENLEIIRKLNLSAIIYPAVLADITNENRLAEGVGELVWSETLAEAAKRKAEDMLANQYFAHTSPRGVTPWHWLVETGYNFVYAGENLAIRFNDSARVQDAWLNSPTHRANILNGRFTEIGIAAVDGVFEGSLTTVVVEFFGVPAVVSPLSKPIESTPEPEPQNVVEPESLTPPIIAGLELENQRSLETKAIVLPAIETLQEENAFIVVKNTEPVVEAQAGGIPASRSFWYERLIVNPTDAIRTVYLFIIGAILIAMALMLFKEYERHHMKHFAMGISMVVVVSFLLYLVGPSPTFFI